jgi:hypothetical protein
MPRRTITANAHLAMAAHITAAHGYAVKQRRQARVVLFVENH